MGEPHRFSDGYRAPAVVRAFELLRAVAAAPEGLSLSQLAARLGLSKSTIHGLIRALVQAGALDQDLDRRRYILGDTIADLAFNSWNYLGIHEIAQPVLDELGRRIGESVFLGILSRRRGVIVATAEADKPLKISSPPGTTIPLMAGAVGKIFLARLNDEHVRRLIAENGLPAYTPHSITEEDTYLAELARVRRQGYALDNEEYLPGVRAVAVGLRKIRGLTMALWVVGFAASLDDAKLPAVVDAARKATRRLESALESKEGVNSKK